MGNNLVQLFQIFQELQDLNFYLIEEFQDHCTVKVIKNFNILGKC